MRIVSCLLIFALLLTAGCASGGGARGETQSGRRHMAQADRADVSARAFGNALALKSAGNCRAAVPTFYALAQRGEGFELAQFHLAECLLEQAEASVTSTPWLSGLVWLRRAAEAGLPEAQGALAGIYLDGPQALRDRQEAAFWYVLYESNPARKRPAFAALPDEAVAAFERQLDADLRARAAQRAEDWSPTHWRAPQPRRAKQGEERQGIPTLELDQSERRLPPGGPRDGGGR